MYASCEGGEEIIEALLEHNADTEQKDQNGCTALIIAVKENRKRCVHVLLANGADVNAIDDHGNTPLHLAAFEGNGVK